MHSFVHFFFVNASLFVGHCFLCLSANKKISISCLIEHLLLCFEFFVLLKTAPYSVSNRSRFYLLSDWTKIVNIVQVAYVLHTDILVSFWVGRSAILLTVIRLFIEPNEIPLSSRTSGSQSVRSYSVQFGRKSESVSLSVMKIGCLFFSVSTCCSRRSQFPSLVKFDWIWIAFALFLLVWHQTKFRLFPNRLRGCSCSPHFVVWFGNIRISVSLCVQSVGKWLDSLIKSILIL